jgi:molecular chaperone GrpE (heat shock protein)
MIFTWSSLVEGEFDRFINVTYILTDRTIFTEPKKTILLSKDMSKSWVIWSLLFILTGIFGLGGVFLDKHSEDRQILLYKAQYNEDTDEYLQLYEEWRQLTPAEQAQWPWGQGKYGGPEIRKKVQAEQPSRLRADIADLASGVKEPHILADILYGDNWPQEIVVYKKRQGVRESLALAGTVSVLSGILVVIGHFSYRLAIGFLSRLKRSKNDRVRGVERQKEKPSLPKKPTLKRQEPLVAASKLGNSSGLKPKEPVAKPKELFAEPKEPVAEPKEPVAEPKEPVDEPKEPVDEPILNNNNETKEPIGSRSAGLQKFGVDSLEFKETLRNQAENYRHQESSQLETLVEEGEVETLMSTAPVTENLIELTQEVSAIREFAAQQQDRVRQLQDGYDWNIIKRFCLRVIRCIDNIDERIRKFREQGESVEELEDVRDELVFALESSGVEQFEPEVKNSYKGLEKCVEAVHERVKTKDKTLTGKIARIVKPGYQYVVSEDDAKIVRCSQVMLYS